MADLLECSVPQQVDAMCLDTEIHDVHMIGVTVNGVPRSFPEGSTVQTVVESEGYDPKRIAVEVNMDIIPRGTYPGTEIHNGDRIEVVSFVGGG